MPQPLVGMELSGASARLSAPDQPGTAPDSSTKRSTTARSPTWFRSPRCRPALRDDSGRAATPSACPKSRAVYESTDGTRRYLLRLDDGRTVETVLMPEGERDTICISSQVGCPVDCKFCMTALLGLERSLTAGEIVGQVLLVARDNGLRPDGGAPQHRHDGAGRAAAQPGQRGQGHAHSARPRRLRHFRRAASPSPPPASFRRSRNWAASRCGRSWRSRSTPPPKRCGRS